MKNLGAATLSISALLATTQACASALPCPAPVTPVQVATPTPPALTPVLIEFEGLSLRVQSVQVSAARPSADEGRFVGARGMWSQTALELLVSDAQARLIGIAPEQTRLDACEDETGEPVALRGPGHAGPETGWSERASVSSDRSVMVVRLSCPGTATPGAREVRVRGRLGVAIGGNRATATGTLELRDGQSVTLGDVELRFRSVRPGDDPGTLRVEFDAPGGLTGFQGLEDLSATSEGEPVQILGRSQMSFSGPSGSSTRVELVIDRPDATQLELSASYTDHRVIVVPIDLAVGVGL